MMPLPSPINPSLSSFAPSGWPRSWATVNDSPGSPVQRVARNGFARGIAACADKASVEFIRGLLAPFPLDRSVASLLRQKFDYIRLNSEV